MDSVNPEQSKTIVVIANPWLALLDALLGCLLSCIPSQSNIQMLFIIDNYINRSAVLGFGNSALNEDFFLSLSHSAVQLFHVQTQDEAERTKLCMAL